MESIKLARGLFSKKPNGQLQIKEKRQLRGGPP
jgi:hypothetical protein